jgi:hypothetical protein
VNITSPRSALHSPKSKANTTKNAAVAISLQRPFDENLETYRSVMDSLQVPLRVPLDLGYSQGNRRVARVIFETELVNKVKEASVKREMDIEATKAQIIARAAKSEKRYAKEVKDRD